MISILPFLIQAWRPKPPHTSTSSRHLDFCHCSDCLGRMSRAKATNAPVLQSEPRYKPVDAYGGTEPPEWNDLFRGLLVALIQKHSALWNVHFLHNRDKVPQFRATKEKILDIMAGEIAPLLQQQDVRMNAWAILEKWCWMVEMYARSVEFKFTWRYTNSMNFLATAPASGVNIYLGCLNADRFEELTVRYAQTVDEQKATSLSLGKKNKKFALGTSLFIPEMSLYAEICQSPHPGSIAVVVSTANGVTPLQLVGAPSFIVQAQTTASTTPQELSPPKRRGRTSSKYSRTRNSSSTQEPIPTSVSELLNSLATPTTSTSRAISPSSNNNDVPTTSIAIKEEAGEIVKGTESTEYTQEVVVSFIEAVKARPDIWDPEAELTSERKILWKEVEDSLPKPSNSRPLTDCSVTWRRLNNYIQSENLKTWPEFGKIQIEDIKPMLQFLTDKNGQATFSDQGVGSVFMTPGGMTNPEIQAQLQKILGFVPQEISPRENQQAQKRPRIASPSMREPAPKKNCDSTQIVTTWVPPKENDISNAFAAVAASVVNPTATAQILSTSSGIPLSGLFTHNLDHSIPSTSKHEKKNQVNGFSKRNSVYSHSEPKTEAKEDKWNLLGRLVEQTCRELEQRDMETAVHLQRELSEVLFKYQLQVIKKT